MDASRGRGLVLQDANLLEDLWQRSTGPRMRGASEDESEAQETETRAIGISRRQKARSALGDIWRDIVEPVFELFRLKVCFISSALAV
jgi:hypothetical protein